MRIHTLAVIAAFAFMAEVFSADQTPGAAGAPAATEAWTQILNGIIHHEPLKSDEDKAGFYGRMAAEISEFIKSHSDDANVLTARSLRDQFQYEQWQMGDASIDVNAIREDFLALANSKDTPPGLMRVTWSYLLKIATANGSPEDVETALTAYEKTGELAGLPPEFLRKVAEKLAAKDPERAKELTAQADENEKKIKAAEAEREKFEAARLAMVNKPLDLTFTAADGSEVDLSKMRGKVVLVDFWATWCGPCMKEVPHVVEAYQKYHDKGFEIVGISFDQDKAALLETTKQKGMVWQQYFDGKGWENELGKKFGIRAIPQMWLVNKEGLLVDLNGREDFESKVVKLLEESPVDGHSDRS